MLAVQPSAARVVFCSQITAQVVAGLVVIQPGAPPVGPTYFSEGPTPFDAMGGLFDPSVDQLTGPADGMDASFY